MMIGGDSPSETPDLHLPQIIDQSKAALREDIRANLHAQVGGRQGSHRNYQSLVQKASTKKVGSPQTTGLLASSMKQAQQ